MARVDLDYLRDAVLYMLEDFAVQMGVRINTGYDTEGIFLPHNLGLSLPKTYNPPKNKLFVHADSFGYTPPKSDLQEYQYACWNWRVRGCEFFYDQISKLYPKYVGDIYADPTGLFVFEPVTHRLSLEEGALAAAVIEKEMVRLAPDFTETGTSPILRGAFGPVKLPEYSDIKFLLNGSDPFGKREVFNVNGEYIIPARGRHHHISGMIDQAHILSYDDKNSGAVNDRQFTNLAGETVKIGLTSINHTFPILRPDVTSYLRCVDEKGQPYNLESCYEKVGDGIIRYRSGVHAEQVNLEFIAADANSDPRDVAIISATSFVLALMKYAERDAGGFVFEHEHYLILKPEAKELLKTPHRIIPGEVPTSLEQAFAAFNNPENPFFKAIDIIAEEYLKLIKDKHPRDKEKIAAALGMQRAGTKLYNGYLEMFADKMKEYGITPQTMLERGSWAADAAGRKPFSRV